MASEAPGAASGSGTSPSPANESRRSRTRAAQPSQGDGGQASGTDRTPSTVASASRRSRGRTCCRPAGPAGVAPTRRRPLRHVPPVTKEVAPHRRTHRLLVVDEEDGRAIGASIAVGEARKRLLRQHQATASGLERETPRTGELTRLHSMVSAHSAKNWSAPDVGRVTDAVPVSRFPSPVSRHPLPATPLVRHPPSPTASASGPRPRANPYTARSSAARAAHATPATDAPGTASPSSGAP